MDKPVSYYEESVKQGLTFLEAELYDEAIAAFRLSIDRDSENYEAWFQLALALDYLGREEEAVPAYLKVLKLRAPVNIAFKARTFLASGYVNLAKKQFVLASDFPVEIISDDPAKEVLNSLKQILS